MKPKSIYFDHAATTPIRSEVRAAMEPFLADEFYNPSSLYSAARKTRLALEEARSKVAQVLGAKTSEVIFTAGGTESVNLAIRGVLQGRTLQNTNAVTTAIEHDAVMKSIEQFDHKIVPVKADGIVDVAEMEKAIDDQTILVSVMYANNEIGTVQPIAEVSKLITNVRQDRQKRKVALPIYFHTDACQAPDYLDLHVSRLGIDLMSLNGSKIYGPKQTGCLYVRTGTEIGPMILGGGQERNLRSGTENVAGSIGFAGALELAQVERESEAKRLTELRDYTLGELKKSFDDLIINGHPTRRLANNINLTIPGIDGESAVLYLDKAGIMVSTGSACSTGNTEPSHVLLALGRTEAEANASLRLSFGRGTTKPEVDYFLKVLPPIIKRLRELVK